MYEQFFGFTEKPFSLNPDPSFLYLGKGHSRALSMLEFGLASETGLTVVTGEIGAGKTTLLRYMLDQLGDDDYTVGLITNTHAAFGDLIHWVASAYGLEHAGKSKVTLYEEFVDFLISEYAEGRRVVLMVDEAQNLDPDALEELRILSNINADKDILLQIVVSGQPELRKTLRRPSLKQFVQRVTSYHHLKPLTLADTREYIAHRLKVAGIEVPIFDPAAILLIYKYCQGVPRVINIICHLGLTYAFGDKNTRVTEATVRDVIRDREAEGLSHRISVKKKKIAKTGDPKNVISKTRRQLPKELGDQTFAHADPKAKMMSQILSKIDAVINEDTAAYANGGKFGNKMDSLIDVTTGDEYVVEEKHT